MATIGSGDLLAHTGLYKSLMRVATVSGPADYINMRILESSGKAQYKVDSRNHGS